MPAGLQVFNTAGTYQIDGTFPGFVFKRKVIVTCSTKVLGNTLSYYRGTFTINQGEIFAIRSSEPCCMNGSVNGQMYLASMGPQNTQIEVYVFSQITSSGANSGLQVFSESGQLVFCATQKPLSFVGFPSGDGDFYYTAGRTYAAICLTQYLYVSDQLFVVNPGANPTFNRVVLVREGMITALSNGIRISTLDKYANASQPPSLQGQPPSQSCQSNAPNFHAIIDVTNFN